MIQADLGLLSDPDPDHPKGTHGKTKEETEKIKSLKFVHGHDSLNLSKHVGQVMISLYKSHQITELHMRSFFNIVLYLRATPPNVS